MSAQPLKKKQFDAGHSTKRHQARTEGVDAGLVRLHAAQAQKSRSLSAVSLTELEQGAELLPVQGVEVQQVPHGVHHLHAGGLQDIWHTRLAYHCNQMMAISKILSCLAYLWPCLELCFTAKPWHGL